MPLLQLHFISILSLVVAISFILFINIFLNKHLEHILCSHENILIFSFANDV